MALKITLKPNSPALRHFSADALNALVASLCVEMTEGDVPVHHGVTAPSDRSRKWQPLDAYGTPVGLVKTWNGTAWV